MKFQFFVQDIIFNSVYPIDSPVTKNGQEKNSATPNQPIFLFGAAFHLERIGRPTLVKTDDIIKE